jgi:hypothetical protein
LIFNVSMRLATPEEAQYPLEGHLRAIYQGVADANQMGQIGPMQFAKTAHGRRYHYR